MLGATKTRATRAALLAAGWTASAGADLPPLPPPPITVPSLTVPTVTVPPVTTPPVTTPSVPQPAQAPPAPTVPSITLPAVRSVPSLPVGGGESGSGAAPAGGSSSSGGLVGSSADTSHEQRAATSPRRVYRLHLARDWVSLSGPTRHPRTMLVFTLGRSTLVEFAVSEVSPDCRRVGRFRVRGHRGLNRIPLRSRVGRYSLSPGTYRFVARTLPGGRKVSDTRLVVVQRLNRREILSARTADACRPATQLVAGPAQAMTTAAGGHSLPARPEHASGPARHRGVLGARFARGRRDSRARLSAAALRAARGCDRAARRRSRSPSHARKGPRPPPRGRGVRRCGLARRGDDHVRAALTGDVRRRAARRAPGRARDARARGARSGGRVRASGRASSRSARGTSASGRRPARSAA
jgi:hypothetical protein